MARLRDEVDTALNETRMLTLGVQVLIGFGYRAFLEPGFAHLPSTPRLLLLVSLALLLCTFGLLLAPAADHRLGERGEDSRAFLRLTTAFAATALLPFAVALAIDVGVAFSTVTTARVGLAAAIVTGAIALTLFYGIEIAACGRRVRRARRNGGPEMDTPIPRGGAAPTPTGDKVRQALIEARVVLPGTQALLGFQLLATLVEGFERLPLALKWLHLASLACIAVAVVLLMAPAAWHRIVLGGEDTPAFYRLASGMVVGALVPLALGLCGDLYLVTETVAHSPAISLALAGSLLALYAALWFGVGLARRARDRGAPRYGRRAPV